MASPKALAGVARERVPLLDHLIRAAKRYQSDAGDRLAASVTYYWFLSLFPILLLVVAILGYALGDDAEQRVVDGIGDQLPEGLASELGQTLTNAKGPAGVIGLFGLLYAGLGWVDALREAIRTMWHQNIKAGNFIVKKLKDVVILLGLFGVIASSVFVTGFVTGFSDEVLDILGVESTGAATAFTRLAGYALALTADTMLFLYLFTRLSRVKSGIRSVLPGALFGAVGFEILKVLGGIYVARTTQRGEATYGAFAVVVGLLLFLFLLSRLILFAAAFAVTAKGSSDVAPSGTADPELAIEAGIPVSFAQESDPEQDPITLRVDGAPSPLRQALRDNPDEANSEPADTPASQASTAVVGPRLPAPDETAPARQSFLPSSEQEMTALREAFPPPHKPANEAEKKVVLAARAAAAAGGALLAGTAYYASRTVAGMLRRR